MRWFILAVLGGLGVLGTASAQQTIPMSPELLKFMSTPEEQRRVRSHEFDDWEATMAGCADTPNLAGATIVVYVAPKFDASGRPVDLEALREDAPGDQLLDVSEDGIDHTGHDHD